MKVFVSWSGERSKIAATGFKDWLLGVVQAAKPWMSSDIEAGQKWTPAIAKELEESEIGVFFLTPENLDDPWLLFEAGSIAKTEISRVAGLLFDGLTPTDVKPPLGLFQLKEAVEQGVRDIVNMLNSKLPEPLLDAKLNEVFDLNWPKLKAVFESIGPSPQDAPVPARPERDLLVEILEGVRKLNRFAGKTPAASVTAHHATQLVNEILRNAWSPEEIHQYVDGIKLQYGIFWDDKQIEALIHFAGRERLRRAIAKDAEGTEKD